MEEVKGRGVEWRVIVSESVWKGMSLGRGMGKKGIKGSDFRVSAKVGREET